MKRVVFFIYPERAFGSIHYELCKYLFPKGVDAVLLPWNAGCSYEEMQELSKVTDVFVTNPDGYHWLAYTFGIDPTKITIIAHAILDLHQLISARGIDEFNKPKNFAVVSEFLKDEAKRLGIQRKPEVLPIGINVNRYSMKSSEKLTTVGYAGVFHRIDNHTQYDLKRGYLVEKCAKIAGLKFKLAESYHNSFVTMAGFYTSVDCVIVASTEEGACLPVLEAGAAGRLVITTPVGHWKERGGEKGGHTVPIEEDKFISETAKLLNFYKNNPKAYKDKCREIKKHSKSYDWSHVIDKWTDILSRS